MNDSRKSFQYSYSAPQHKEIQDIRNKYLPKKENKMDQLRKLDRQATTKGAAPAIVTGIAGCLFLGIGMSCTMVWKQDLFIPGIIVGVIGLCFIGVAYPVFTHVTKKERAKIAPEILRLAKELEEHPED